MAGNGNKFEFFGSFKRKKDAVREERKEPGTFIRKIHPRNAAKGLTRYLVLKPKGR
jgi:hypothetical protein